MVTYNCEICNKIFDKKSHFTQHLNKKYPCKQIINLNYEKNLNLPPNSSNFPPNSSNFPPNSSDLPKIISKKIKQINNNDLFVCDYCKKQFTRFDNRIRHLDNRCKIKKQADELELLKQKYENALQEIDNFKKQLGEYKPNENINNIKNNIANIANITNINNNNITQNINIIQFGKEDLSKISNNLILNTLLKSSGQPTVAFSINTKGAGIPSMLVENIHFNDDYPEYKNICITDMNRKYALLWNGKKWIKRKYDNIGNELLDKCLFIITERLDEIKETLPYDKKLLGIKLKALDRLENKDPNDEPEYSEEDDILIQSRIEDRKNFRKMASDKIEEVLYNNKDKIKN